MSSTTSTTEDVSDAQQPDILFERPGYTYGYLGWDTENFHHVDQATNTIYVTQQIHEQFLSEGAGVYWVRLRGDPAHVEYLDQYDDRGLDHWIVYVKMVCGWTDRPTDYGAMLTDVLRGDSE